MEPISSISNRVMASRNVRLSSNTGDGPGMDVAYLLPYERYSPIGNTVRIGVSIRK